LVRSKVSATGMVLGYGATDERAIRTGLAVLGSIYKNHRPSSVRRNARQNFVAATSYDDDNPRFLREVGAGRASALHRMQREHARRSHGLVR
jgi:hypothetical protein